MHIMRKLCNFQLNKRNCLKRGTINNPFSSLPFVNVWSLKHHNFMQSVLELFCQRSHYPLLPFKETYLHINDGFIHIGLMKQPLYEGICENHDCFFPTQVQQSFTVVMKSNHTHQHFTHIQHNIPIFKKSTIHFIPKDYGQNPRFSIKFYIQEEKLFHGLNLIICPLLPDLVTVTTICSDFGY